MTREGIDLFRLDGRVALVTGATKGVGWSIARGLASAGANVAVCSRHIREAESAAGKLEASFGLKSQGILCDVTHENMVTAMVSTVIAEFGKIDILVNNAGLNIRGPIENLSLSQFEQVMSTNITGPWLVSRAVVPHMRKRSYGRIINISSTLGTVGAPNRTPYGASKGAVSQFSRMLAVELAKDEITVNTISPGPFLTSMTQAIADTEDFKRFVLGQVLLGRCALMHEIQGAAIFLASDAASYVTGTTLFVDGGWTAW